MKTCIIYHSYSGITRGLAERLKDACGGDLVEVRPRQRYTTLSAYTLGCYRARNGECDPTEPDTIDVASCDLIVIGTPVWAWRATPVANAAIAALSGCAGKKAVIFATCGGQPGETLPLMRKALEAKGVKVTGEAVFTRKDLEDTGACVGELAAVVKAAEKAG